jgi:hypothetical protein
MRSALAAEVTPLLGSLALHGGAVLALLLAVHRSIPTRALPRERADAWAGNAVEVDAVATPEETPNPSNSAPATAKAKAEEIAQPTGFAPAKAKTEPQPAPEIAPNPKRPRAHRVLASELSKPSGAAPPAAAVPNGGRGAPSLTAGAFGGEGSPLGVRDLPSAFTRAIPPATGADPIWQTLPTGSERPFTLAIEVDPAGHISSAEILKEKNGSATETQATHVRQRVIALLGAGQFALQSEVGAGRALFRITITLSDRPTHDEDEQGVLVERGFDPPRGASPGRAYFTLASGRHFEATVQVLTHP